MEVSEFRNTWNNIISFKFIVYLSAFFNKFWIYGSNNFRYFRYPGKISQNPNNRNP